MLPLSQPAPCLHPGSPTGPVHPARIRHRVVMASRHRVSEASSSARSQSEILRLMTSHKQTNHEVRSFEGCAAEALGSNSRPWESQFSGNAAAVEMQRARQSGEAPWRPCS